MAEGGFKLFSTLALDRGLNTQTIEVLQQMEITSVDLLAMIKDREIDSLSGVTLGQKARLRTWRKDVAGPPTPSVEVCALGDNSPEQSPSTSESDELEDDQQMDKNIYTGEEAIVYEEQLQMRYDAIQKTSRKDTLSHRATEFVGYLRQKVRKKQKLIVNIVIVGQVAVGKSTVINTLCGMGPHDVGAAGYCTGTGFESYHCPDLDRARLWDLCETTTSTLVSEESLKHPDFAKYHAFVVATSTVFSNDDVVFAIEARKLNKQVFLLRTNADVNLKQAADNTEIPEKEKMDEVVQIVRGSLAGTPLAHVRIYVVSGLLEHVTRWDWLSLVDDVKGWIKVATCVHDLGMTEAAADDIRQFVIENGMDGLPDYLAQTLSRFKENHIHIAVTGQAGTGKSTLINTIRGLRDEDEGLAPVDNVECTLKPTPYPFPRQTNVHIWDLPGAGTDRFPAETYVEDVKFRTYDAFIIVTATRFLKCELDLAEEAHNLNKPFYLLRSKIDNDTRDHKRKKKKNDPVEDMLHRLKLSLEASLKNRNLPSDNVYLVSGILKHHAKWDFPRFVEELVNNTKAKDRETILFLAISCSEEILKKKKVPTATLR